ncbi:hypothetical protein COCCU_05060 [Corynebacterium occultum]|uniref:Uncharacterized protein n=1 Tax=Corynebacterium occultum TaxID=2675219 RepID=A0A6B8WKK4_9CORY|nr:hypothetical protein [Corynebacterium occultum]QGU06958.1 hypothetical protein COCCU_05060 [Corynebacterium occultum]
MPFTPYPLPARGAGSSRRNPVEGTNQAILFSHLHDRALHDDGVEVPVTLLPDHRTQGFKVKWDYGVIGTLPASFKEEYPQLVRVTGSQLTPEVRALVEVSPERGGLSVDVLLPEPQWVVPVNDPPIGLWTLLPSGAPAPVDLSAGADVPADELASLFQAQLLVKLSLVNERVAVAYGNRVLGVLGEADSAVLRDAIEHFAQLGLDTVARAFLNGDEITVECARTEELDDAALEPEISPLPALQLPAFEKPGGTTTQGIVEDPGGGWSLHIPSSNFEAITPAKIEEHKQKKRISSPKLPPVSATQVIPVVDIPEEPVQGIVPGGPAQQRVEMEPLPVAEEPLESSSKWLWIIGVLFLIIFLLLFWGLFG